MAEIVGVDHVSIGTDQFDARGCVEDYNALINQCSAVIGKSPPGPPGPR